MVHAFERLRSRSLVAAEVVRLRRRSDPRPLFLFQGQGRFCLARGGRLHLRSGTSGQWAREGAGRRPVVPPRGNAGTFASRPNAGRRGPADTGPLRRLRRVLPRGRRRRTLQQERLRLARRRPPSRRSGLRGPLRMARPHRIRVRRSSPLLGRLDYEQARAGVGELAGGRPVRSCRCAYPQAYRLGLGGSTWCFPFVRCGVGRAALRRSLGRDVGRWCPRPHGRLP